MRKILYIIIWIIIGWIIFSANVVWFSTTNWVSTVIEKWANIGSLWFWKPNSNTDNKPQFTIKENGVEIAGNIKIEWASPSFGKVLTAIDNNGNAVWNYPNSWINFTEIPGFSKLLSENTGIPLNNKYKKYTGFSITFPDYGVYSITIAGTYWKDASKYPDTNSFRYPIVQFTPSNTNPNSWHDSNIRFDWSYEVYMQTALRWWIGDYRFWISENLTVTPKTGKTAYLWILDENWVNWTIYLWKNAISGCPQCSGGSYTRIK